MAGYLEDLDELILKCRNKNAREYIRESVASYRAEAYRSSIVSCWVAVCYDLMEKFRELALAGDKAAAEKIEVLDAIHKDNDLARSLKFEREILEFSRDKIDLISSLEYEDLHRILKDRNRCAHPSLNAEGEQYAPPAELARLHIHSAVTHLLQHEPAQGKFALERIVTQLNSKYFPSDPVEVLKALQNTPLRRARPSLIRNLTTVLLKKLFLEEKTDYTSISKVTASLNAVQSMHRDQYQLRCKEALPDILSQVSDANLYNAVRAICKLEENWSFIGDTQKARITRYVAQLPTQHFDVIDEALGFAPLEKTARNRVKYASLDDLNEIIPFFVPAEIIDRAISIYHKSRNFDEANNAGALLQRYCSDMSKDQLGRLLAGIQENDQITWSFELPHLLDRIRETVKKDSTDFDQLLRDNGLDKYCENVIEDDDTIPF